MRRIEISSDSGGEWEDSVHDEDSDFDIFADDLGVVHVTADGEDSAEEDEEEAQVCSLSTCKNAK